MTNKLWTAACAAAGIALCGASFGAGAPTSSSKAAEIDACSLLKPAEISQAIGFPVDEGRRRDEGHQNNGSYSSACVWVVQRGEGNQIDPTRPLGGRSFVILNAMQWPAGSDKARTFLQAFHDAAARGEIPNQPAPRKFGDEALWWGDGLAVRKGDVSFGVSVFIPGTKAASPGQREERLAPHILRRLGQRETV